MRCSGPLRSTDYHGLLREQMRLRKQLRTPHVHFQKQTRMLKSRIRKQSCIPKTRLRTTHITKTHSTHRNTKSGRPTKLGKCFRDEDELAASHSLPDSIREALAASRTLIVICSPETQESSWVRREIEMFEQIHGRERIICVLAAGSPEESIPPILKTRMVPDANGVLREMPAEPLAADLRPEAKTKRKAELLRIIAAVAGCSYDDLRQRRASPSVQAHGPRGPRAAALTIAAVGVFAFQFHQTSEAALIAESKSLAAQALDQYDRGEHLQAIETRPCGPFPPLQITPIVPLCPKRKQLLKKYSPSIPIQIGTGFPSFASTQRGALSISLTVLKAVGLPFWMTPALFQSMTYTQASQSQPKAPRYSPSMKTPYRRVIGSLRPSPLRIYF